MTWALVFVAVAVSDALWTAYIRAVTMARPVKAACYSAALVGVGMLVTLTVVSDHMTLIPACAGAFVGTYLVARRG